MQRKYIITNKMSSGYILKTKMIPINFSGDFAKNADEMMTMTENIIDDFESYILDYDHELYIEYILCNIEVPNFRRMNKEYVQSYYGLYIKINNTGYTSTEEINKSMEKYVKDNDRYDNINIFGIDYVISLGNCFIVNKDIEDVRNNIKKILNKEKDKLEQSSNKVGKIDLNGIKDSGIWSNNIIILSPASIYRPSTSRF
ncbi:Hypothetical protein ORPV_493 [Orpheovirus IHUMI-LCC2]|uniref:Uncharacterized protein n=1 Tax=Orpheovirus IHUMI-LCC2 TaxID=2023057 RepID=A0A2I2L4E6_9VIRU|nr:Hypothetical protein ORPV_493 [Orpheovirus IHUMI-LCC2]SNW62397.1 Hypothetical protein ORPV_493 [Orpheovirus IHUMI-LCC2]